MLEIRTVPLGSVLVHVRDSAGNPLEGLPVEYSLEPTIGSDAQLWGYRRDIQAGTSDAHGDVRVTGVPVEMQMRFGLRGEWRKPARVVIEASRGEAEVVLTPPRWASIRGRLEWPDASPAPAIQVAWYGTSNRSGSPGSTGVSTSTDGTFEITELSNGGGMVVFEGEAFRPPIHLRLENGEPVDLGTLTLEKRVVVAGRVVIPGGQDRPQRLGIAAFRSGVLVAQSRVHDEALSFSLRVPRGPVVLAALEGLNWDPEFPYRGESLAELLVEAPHAGVELELGALPGAVKGRIAEARGEVEIIFFDPQPTVDWGFAASVQGGGRRVSLDGSGAFQCPARATEGVRVLIRMDDGRSAYSREVEVVPGEDTDLGLLDMSACRLATRVADEGSNPNADVSVTLADESRAKQVQRTDEEGLAIFELPAGPYALRAETDGQTTGAWQLVQLESGTDRTMTITMTGKGIFTGAVQSPDGPVAGVTIKTQRETPPTNLSWAATTDSDGQFEFQPLLPGTYRYWISGELVGHVDLVPGKPSSLSLSIGDPVSTVQLRRDGERLDWANSLLVTAAAQEPRVWRRAEVDGDGRFLVALPEGPLLFQIDLGGLGNNQITLAPGPARSGADYILDLPTTGIELQLEGSAAHRPNPAGYLEELGDRPAISSWGPHSEIYAEELGGEGNGQLRVVRFPFLAPGARVTITGNTADGKRTSREVRVAAGGWTIVRWQ